MACQAAPGMEFGEAVHMETKSGETISEENPQQLAAIGWNYLMWAVDVVIKV